MRITLARGTSPAYRRALADGVHRALVERAGVPADDRCQVIEEVERENLIADPRYLGHERTPQRRGQAGALPPRTWRGTRACGPTTRW